MKRYDIWEWLAICNLYLLLGLRTNNSAAIHGAIQNQNPPHICVFGLIMSFLLRLLLMQHFVMGIAQNYKSVLSSVLQSSSSMQHCMGKPKITSVTLLWVCPKSQVCFSLSFEFQIHKFSICTLMPKCNLCYGQILTLFSANDDILFWLDL